MSVSSPVKQEPPPGGADVKEMIDEVMGKKTLIETGRLGKSWQINQKRVPLKRKHAKSESKQKQLF